MIIKEGNVVTFNCTIKNTEGKILENCDDGPASYIHGAGQALPAIEEALEGKEPGFKTVLTLKEDEAFGPYNEDLVFPVPLDDFDGQEVAVGMQFQPDADDMDFNVWSVTAIENNIVTLNGNHPYAGMDLIMDIEVLDVREATEEEREHGHVHNDHEA